MSVFAKTTVITVYKENVETDPWDPDYNTDTETITNIRASILEQNSIVSPEGEVRPTDITQAVGRVNADVDVAKGDTILDTLTNKSWIVDEVAQNSNPVMKTDKRLALHRVK